MVFFFFYLFSITYFFHSLYTLIAASLSPLLTVPLLQITLPVILSPSLRRSFGYHLTLGHRVPAGLNISSPTEAQPDNPWGEGDPVTANRVRDSPLVQMLWVPHEYQTTHLLQMCKGPRFSPCMLFGWWFSLSEPPGGGRWGVSVGLLVVSLTLQLAQFYPPLSHKTPQALPNVWLWSLHLFPYSIGEAP